MRCIVVKSDNMDDWWLIERAEHDGREWMERTQYGAAFRRSSRLGNADIEGTAAEMLAIAVAIQRGESQIFTRCAAKHTPDGYLMSSPRNTITPTLITHEEAKALAEEIRTKVTLPDATEGAVRPERGPERMSDITKPDVTKLLADLNEISIIADDYRDERDDDREAEWLAWEREDEASRRRNNERYEAACDRDLRSLQYDT